MNSYLIYINLYMIMINSKAAKCYVPFCSDLLPHFLSLYIHTPTHTHTLTVYAKCWSKLHILKFRKIDQKIPHFLQASMGCLTWMVFSCRYLCCEYWTLTIVGIKIDNRQSIDRRKTLNELHLWQDIFRHKCLHFWISILTIFVVKFEIM